MLELHWELASTPHVAFVASCWGCQVEGVDHVVVGVDVPWATYPDILEEMAIGSKNIVTSCLEESALS
jgi:hypothetical protein